MMSADLFPFAHLAPWQIAIVHGAVALGFFIRGAFGFGSNLPFVLITTWFIGPHHAIVLALVLAAFAQVHLGPQGIKSTDWTVFRPLIIGLLLGAAVGIVVFAALAPDWLTLIMATLIMSILIMDRYNVFVRLGTIIDLRSKRVAIPLASLSGMVGSISGGGGLYFLVAYLKITCANARILRGTNLTLSVVYQMARFVAIGIAGFVSMQVLVESVSLLPAMLVGTYFGRRFFERSSEERFFRAIQAVLLLGAVTLLGKGIVQVLS